MTPRPDQLHSRRKYIAINSPGIHDAAHTYPTNTVEDCKRGEIAEFFESKDAVQWGAQVVKDTANCRKHNQPLAMTDQTNEVGVTSHEKIETKMSENE